MDIVLSGHGHRPHVASRGCTYFVTAGSATLWKADGRSFPSFNVISVERDTIYVQLVDVTGGWGTQTIAAARLRRARTDGDCRPRVTPPLAFEAEEFHSQIPDDDWRLRHGVPQTLDFPAFRY
jgi:hypothetical protein